MELSEIRKTIDEIDTDLLKRFVDRMDIATEVAKSKIEMDKNVFDPARERAKLKNVADRVPDRYEQQTITLFRLLMSMSKAEQQKYINRLVVLIDKMMGASAKGVLLFPMAQKSPLVSWEEIAERWSRTDGVIPVMGRGETLPTQISGNGADAGAQDLHHVGR